MELERVRGRVIAIALASTWWYVILLICLDITPQHPNGRLLIKTTPQLCPLKVCNLSPLSKYDIGCKAEIAIADQCPSICTFCFCATFKCPTFLQLHNFTRSRMSLGCGTVSSFSCRQAATWYPFVRSFGLMIWINFHYETRCTINIALSFRFLEIGPRISHRPSGANCKWTSSEITHSEHGAAQNAEVNQHKNENYGK